MSREHDVHLRPDDDATEAELEALAEEEHGAGRVLAFLGGLVVGALVGAGVALLLAPERGEITRRQVQRRFTDLKEGAREQFEGAREQLEDWRDDAHRELRRQRRRLRRLRKSRV